MQAPTRPLSFGSVGDWVETVAGHFTPGLLTLYSIFRDESFFAPAFLDHYRSLGVEQFVILDDQSVDGTARFLSQQPDVVLLRSVLRFGQPIEMIGADGKRSHIRAGTYFKIAIPHHFEEGRFSLYLDADEFLLLPPGVKGLQEVLATLSSEGFRTVVSSIVEFFPERFSDLSSTMKPASLGDLLAAYPWFQPEPLCAPGPRGVRLVGPSKSMRLFEQHSIWRNSKSLGVRMGLQKRKVRQSPRYKTPIICRGPKTYLIGTHDANVAPPSALMLATAHFVFTSEFVSKVDRARTWRSHTRGADKYDFYAALAQGMASSDASFLDEHSVQYTSSDQMQAAGLMRWPRPD